MNVLARSRLEQKPLLALTFLGWLSFKKMIHFLWVIPEPVDLKVHKIEIFFCFDFEIGIISLLVMSKY